MKLRYRLSAIRHLTGIYTHISADNPRAAREVIRRIRRATKRLETFPYSGRKGEIEGTLKLVVRGLPYVVVYTVETDFVDVLAVFHGRQRRS